MGNLTAVTELFLSSLSDLPSLQLPFFLFFLLIYLLTLTWNLLIIYLIVTDSHLHTPMYFFVGNLASLDLCASATIVPRMLSDLHTKKSISIKACLTQIFFFYFFIPSELFVLAIMSYDRYVAICHPLHYMQMMHRKLCIQMVAIAWFLGFSYSLTFTLNALKIKFCASNIIGSFFCDHPEMLKIACNDISDNILLILLLGGVLGGGVLMMTFLPYVSIVKTVLKMPVNKRKPCATKGFIEMLLLENCVYINKPVNRLKKILPSIVSPMQAGFMTARGVGQNIALATFAISRFTEHKSKALVITLNTDKTFDPGNF
ncbi:olfactory receptor 1G1-like [Gastrophryne carolinensis]